MKLKLGRPAEILLAEDNEDDVLLTRKSFESPPVSVNLHHVENGQECVNFLRKQGRYTTVPTPDLILLDLNMPVMDGREVLSEIVQDDRLRQLPVVILTTSSDERDVLKMYQLRCSAYVVKPVDFDQFQRAIECIADHWFSVAALPPKDN